MEFSHLLFLLFALLPLVHSYNSIYQFCSQNITKNDIWLDNRDAGLKAIMAKTPSSGYSISAAGNDIKAFYSLAQCRGDIGPQDCSDCINVAVKQVRGMCSVSESVVILLDMCFLRYEPTNFFGRVDVTEYKGWVVLREVENLTVFKAAVWPLLNWVKAGAATASNMFGMGKRSLVYDGSDMTIYGMAQCTPDLHGITCMECLENMSALMDSYCDNTDGCLLMCSSCVMRFGINNFFRASIIPDYQDFFDSSSAPSPSPIA